MKLIVTALALAAVAALASASTAATPPIASAPGLIVSQGDRIYVEGRQVTRGSQPTWSPDGRRIAFVRGKPDPDSWEIYVMNADGSGARKLTKGASPAWQPLASAQD